MAAIIRAYYVGQFLAYAAEAVIILAAMIAVAWARGRK